MIQIFEEQFTNMAHLRINLDQVKWRSREQVNSLNWKFCSLVEKNIFIGFSRKKFWPWCNIILVSNDEQVKLEYCKKSLQIKNWGLQFQCLELQFNDPKLCCLVQSNFMDMPCRIYMVGKHLIRQGTFIFQIPWLNIADKIILIRGKASFMSCRTSSCWNRYMGSNWMWLTFS